MCSGGMFEDGLGVQERPFLQLQIGGGSIHAFFFSPILAHDCPFGETLTYGRICHNEIYVKLITV